jgi:hypothetical protein
MSEQESFGDSLSLSSTLGRFSQYQPLAKLAHPESLPW